MRRLLRFLLWLFARFVLSLRYRVRIHGGEKLKQLKGPTLILPNHPAFVDPPIVLTHLLRTIRLRPLLFETNFRNPLLYPLMYLLDAIRIPDTDQASAEARARAEEAVQKVIAALKQ